MADVAIEPQLYQRPAEMRKPMEPTTQAHLAAAQRALQLTLDLLTSMYSRYSSGGPGELTILYGGYLERTQKDLNAAVAANAEAIAWVKAHPAESQLANGPVPTDEPTEPAHLKLHSGPVFDVSTLAQAVDALAAGLEALVNNPARDFHGPILGSINGHRAIIIAAITQAGTDLSNAISFNRNTRGGDTGIIPLSAPAGLMPDPDFGPKAKTYLEVAGQ